MATKLTDKRKRELTKKWGFTDSELNDVLNEDPDGEDEGGDDISELATNMGYVWSFKLKRWFDKNQGQLDGDQKDFDALLEEVGEEGERQ